MAGNPWVIRRATAEDGAFLADMLVEAANWSAEWKKKSRRRVLSAPATAHYVAGWPRDTDLGVIAEVADRLLRLAGAELTLVPDRELMRPVDVPVVRGDPTRLHEATGWEPEYDLDTTLRDVLDQWRDPAA